uniref:Uncharacterized protein n=1 Tax=Arundo donax TaxID=35708 RepID=A0A0A8Y840_ARUDO
MILWMLCSYCFSYVTSQAEITLP